MSIYAQMGKEELRKACKAAGVTYSKLNNAGMREALEAHKQNVAVNERIAAAQTETKQEAPKIEGPRATTVGTVVESKSLKIEKGRTSSNGVTRPSVGSICRAVWDALDAKRIQIQAIPSFENVRDLMKMHNWARNTAFTQYQRWKQYHGVMPRTPGEVNED